MRNYVRFRAGTVMYRLKDPPGQPTLTQYVLQQDQRSLEQSMIEFANNLDPAFFEIVQGPFDMGNIYWLLDKDLLFEVLNGFPGWWNLIGTNVISTESPRKSWSHGE